MFETWGSVDGDGNADAIIADRREGRKGATISVLFNAALLASCALWYAMSESSLALAIEIIAAAWLASSGVQRALYQAHTLIMITERRAQLIEQQMQALSLALHTRR